MTPELVSAVGVAITGILGAWNARQGRRIKSLEQTAESLTGWKTVATGYIGTLLFLMAERGIKPPTPPEALGLTITTTSATEMPEQSTDEGGS